jgi:hypothetical protein
LHQFNVWPTRHYHRTAFTLVSLIFVLFDYHFVMLSTTSITFSLLIMCSSYCIFCPLMKLVTGDILTMSSSSLFYLLLLLPVHSSWIGLQILLQILFSNVFSFLSVFLVVVRTLQPYVRVGLTISVYNLTLVFLERHLNINNFVKREKCFFSPS